MRRSPGANAKKKKRISKKKREQTGETRRRESSGVESINLAGIEFIGNYFSRAYARPVRRGIEDKDEGETGGCERGEGV